MLFAQYGSDSEGDGSSSPPLQTKSLPSAPTPSSAQVKPKKAPKKIAIDLPAVSKSTNQDEDVESERPTKRLRTEGKGAGSSALLSMLPAPKVKNPTPAAPPRMLGGGGKPGLIFNASSSLSSAPPSGEGDEDSLLKPETSAKSAASTFFAPPSLAKGKANISLEDGGIRPLKAPTNPPKPSAPPVDFFSLGAEGSSSSTSSNTKSFSLPKVSSAPKVAEFIPPEPTPNDPYPGYYMQPSGEWAQYDTDYYQKFYKKWKADYDAQIRAFEKGVEKGFEGAENEETKEINAQREMERARHEVQELEERKKLTMGGDQVPAAPNMNIQGAKLGKGARSRHQLTTLLADAYANREALEAQIAAGKRNRKEAGNKYGF